MTKHPLSFALIIVPAAFLGACQTTGTPSQTAQTPADPPAFVEAACGGCHAVAPPFLSPNPQAPGFEAIANRTGITDETLGEWLADAHNYPEVMDFDLDADQVDQIAVYMLTLRRADYQPAPYQRPRFTAFRPSRPACPLRDAGHSARSPRQRR